MKFRMRRRINSTDWLTHEKIYSLIYSLIYSAFTHSRLGGTGFFLKPQIAPIFYELQILQIIQKL